MRIFRATRPFVPRLDGWSGHVWQLSRAQADRGHQVIVAQAVRTPLAEGSLDVRYVSTPWPRGRRGRRWHEVRFGLGATRVLLTAHRAARLDVVHVHGDVVDVVAVAGCARVLGIPTVLTLHSSLNVRPTYRAAARGAFRLVDGFIGVSDDIRDELCSAGVDEARVAVISSGVTEHAFRRDEAATAGWRGRLGLAPGEIAATFVGRLHPVKGLTTLLDAWARLPHDAPMRLVVIGDGPLREVVRAAAAHDRRIVWLGAVARDDVRGILGASHVFVLPSVDLPGHREGTPTAAIEAMAAGLPIVTTDSGGLRSLVREGVHGAVVEQGDAAALADALRRLAHDPEARARMGRANVAVARDRTWGRLAVQVEAVYAAAIARRRPGPTRAGVPVSEVRA